MAGSLECRGSQFDGVGYGPIADVARAALLPHPADVAVSLYEATLRRLNC